MIRAASADESQRLSELALRSKGHWGYPDDFLEACRDELLVEPGPDREYFCAQYGDTIAGFYGLTRLDDDCVELEALFVEPTLIGRGFGRQLLEHAIAHARRSGATRMLIQGDPNAERFYRAAGGVKVGERPSGSIPGRVLPLFEITLKA